MNAVRKSLAALALSTLALSACAGAHSALVGSSAAASTRTRWVGTHGIEVAVPAAWRLRRGMCGTPKANTVLWNEDAITTCLTGQPRGLSVVEFWGVLRRPRGWYRRHTTPVTIDGVRARRSSGGMVAGSREVQLAFLDRGITVHVLSPDRSLLRRLLASVRVVRVDHNGCPTRPAPAYRLGSRPSASQRLVPSGAIRVVGCSYDGRWLDQSNRIGRRRAARLTRALDAAPYGFSHAAPGSILPSICGSTWRGSLIIAHFEYAGRRPPTAVSAHLDGCSRLGASNGRWAVRLRPGWVSGLVSDAHYYGGFVRSG
jgi:hypothetical protein